MISLQIVLGDYDQRYVQKLSSYLMNHQNHHFSVKTFSEVSHLKSHLQNNPTDILLITEDFYLKLEAVFPMAILLVEHAISSALKSLPSIRKYQSGDQIIHQFMNYYTLTSNKELIGHIEKGGTKLWGIYSPSGGSGKTTLALALAQAFALRGHSTLFLSLEEIASYARLFECDGQTSISDLLYHAKKRTDNLLMKLEGIKRVDKTTELKFIPPPIYPQDMLTFEDEDWRYLIDQLLNYSSFENIVLDFTSELSTRNLWLMSQCKKLLVLTNLSFIQNCKVEAFLQVYKEHPNTILTVNLTKPIVEEAVSSIKNTPIQLNFPFSQELFINKGAKVMLRVENDFKEAINDLMEVLSHD